MPRTREKYVSKNIRKQWDTGNMTRAIIAVKEHSLTCRQAAKTYCVSRSTLQSFLKVDGDPDRITVTTLGRKTVLCKQLEEELVDYILTMEAKFYGLTGRDIRIMAYKLVEQNDMINPFRNEIAGRSWLDGFLRDADFITEEAEAVKRCSNSKEASTNSNSSQGQSASPVSSPATKNNKNAKSTDPECSNIDPQPGSCRIVDDLPAFSKDMNAQPGCSKSFPALTSGSSKLLKFVSPFAISPVPSIQNKVTNRGKKSSKSKIITSSPYKNDLEISVEKVNYISVKGKRNVFGKTLVKGKSKSQAKPQKPKKTVEPSDSESEEGEIFIPDDEDKDFGTRPEDEDAECIYCEGLFSDDVKGELWVRCLMCHMWAHEACADTERGEYICDFCK